MHTDAVSLHDVLSLIVLNSIWWFLHSYCIVIASVHLVTVRSSRDSSVGMATGYGAERPGLDPRNGQEIFLFSITSRPALVSPQPLIQWVQGATSPGVKRQEREADHSSPYSAEVFMAMLS
jgi:hypothetical protein